MSEEEDTRQFLFNLFLETFHDAAEEHFRVIVSPDIFADTGTPYPQQQVERMALQGNFTIPSTGESRGSQVVATATALAKRMVRDMATVPILAAPLTRAHKLLTPFGIQVDVTRAEDDLYAGSVTLDLVVVRSQRK